MNTTAILRSFITILVGVILFVSFLLAVSNGSASYIRPTLPVDKTSADILRELGAVSEEVSGQQLRHILKGVSEVAEYIDVDPYLVLALIWTESNFRETLVSGAGACGLMQVQEQWHKARMEKYGTTQLFGVYSNLLVGCDYLKECITARHGDIREGLCIYNGGPSAVAKGYSDGYARTVLDRYGRVREAFSSGKKEAAGTIGG